jgi:hypothetical protein
MWRLIIVIAALLLAGPVSAAAPGTINQYNAVCSPDFPLRCAKPDVNGALPIVGSFSASFANFTPTGSASLAVTAVSARVPLPNGDVTVVLQNTGTANIFYKLGTGSVVAAPTDYSLPAGYQISLSIAGATNVAAITASGTATLQVIQGTGTPQLSGGGGSGGGGGGPVTMASGAVASGAYASGSIADGAIVTLGAKTDAKNTATDATSITAMQVFKEISAMEQAPAVRGVTAASGAIAAGAIASGAVAAGAYTTGALATGSGVDGWDAAEGTKADSACGTDSGTCSLIALSKKIAANITTLVSSLQGTGTIGSAPPSTGSFTAGSGSGATGGLLAGLKMCDLHAKYDASDNGSITLVTGVSGRKVYICGYIMAVGGTATNLKLREGSDANCVTSAADLTPAYQLTANQSIGANSAFWNGLAVSTNAYFVCINASAGNAHQAELWYTIQ